MKAFCGFRIGDWSATNVACRGAKWKVLSRPAIVCIRSSISTDAKIIRLDYYFVTMKSAQKASRKAFKTLLKAFKITLQIYMYLITGGG